ncbi:DUF3099 domain-containing protein [Specibacter cremeus]|uniref:DUF3099 domain-containing protein n=1 Tax=Specibacter cremeus TaxID=1629051 RepID=UPI001F0BEBF8|nr:DUF3099 domain-containing protein [Specibacter cremeus]
MSITGAPAAHSDEIHDRMVKYAVTMGIRMVCIGLIFVFDGWYRLIPVVGAVVLPWVAVVIANAGSDTSKIDTSALLEVAPMDELTEEPWSEADEVLQGEVVDDSLIDDDDGGPADAGDGTADAEEDEDNR